MSTSTCKNNLSSPIFVILWCLCLKGCPIPIDIKWVHDPVLAKNVPRLIKGKTTREEVVRYLGPPDVEVDGTNVKANPAAPIFRIEGISSAFSAKVFEKSTPYSSMDAEHIAFIYIDRYAKGVIFLPGPGWTSAHNNKLLIFINKKTGLVDEFAYREELKAD
ncbi:MAG: hypothetical protein MN733_02575 [Nitrososphaera sp.]|nr:hypothetical protein [Nitrososphaera sp.]